MKTIQYQKTEMNAMNDRYNTLRNHCRDLQLRIQSLEVEDDSQRKHYEDDMIHKLQTSYKRSKLIDELLNNLNEYISSRLEYESNHGLSVLASDRRKLFEEKHVSCNISMLVAVMQVYCRID